MAEARSATRKGKPYDFGNEWRGSQRSYEPPQMDPIHELLNAMNTPYFCVCPGRYSQPYRCGCWRYRLKVVICNPVPRYRGEMLNAIPTYGRWRNNEHNHFIQSRLPAPSNVQYARSAQTPRFTQSGHGITGQRGGQSGWIPNVPREWTPHPARTEQPVQGKNAKGNNQRRWARQTPNARVEQIPEPTTFPKTKLTTSPYKTPFTFI